MKNTYGTVRALFISTGDPKRPRKEVTSLEVDTNGIIGDKFYAKDPHRSILISSQQSYEIAKENGIDIEVGSLGENIFIDINPYTLLPGETIKIGEIELEVTQNCTLCKGLSSLNSKLPKLLKNDRGIFVKAKKKGRISLKDLVTIQRS